MLQVEWISTYRKFHNRSSGQDPACGNSQSGLRPSNQAQGSQTYSQPTTNAVTCLGVASLDFRKFSSEQV